MACRGGPDVRLPDQRLSLTPRCPLMIATLHHCPDLKVASVAAEASESFELVQSRWRGCDRASPERTRA